MPILSVTDPRGGVWLYNPDTIYAIVRAAVRTRLIRNRSRVVTENPGWFLPTTWHLETDWSGYRAEMDSEAARYWAEAQTQLRIAPATFFGTLVGLVSDAISDNAWYRNQQTTLNRRSMQNINRVVDNWETALTATRMVRDGSATVLIAAGAVLAAPVGAGAAAAGAAGIGTGGATTLVAAGSVMRGAFTYQDTGNVGSAMINAVGSFTVGMIGVGGAAAGAMSTAEQATIILVSSGAQGATAAGQAVVEGKSMRQAAAAAAIGAGSQALGGVIGTRIGDLGFWTQVGIGAGLDLAGNQVQNRVVDSIGAPPSTPPATGGNIDFLGLPAAAAETYVRRYVLRPR